MKPKIPKGWRELRQGQVICRSHRWWNSDKDWRNDKGWCPFTTKDSTVGEKYDYSNRRESYHAVHIQRITKPTPDSAKKKRLRKDGESAGKRR